MNEADRKFFRPKWRRVTATVFCFGWTLVEWLSGEPFWGMIAAGITFTVYGISFINLTKAKKPLNKTKRTL